MFKENCVAALLTIGVPRHRADVGCSRAWQEHQERLRRERELQKPLANAAAQGDTAALRAALAQPGAKIGDLCHLVALMKAWPNRAAVLMLLISSGADLSITNQSKRTAEQVDPGLFAEARRCLELAADVAN